MKQSSTRVVLIVFFVFLGCFGVAYAAAGMLTALPTPAVGGTCGPSTGSETAAEALVEPGSIGAGPKPPASNVTAHRQWITFVQQCQDLADRRGLASAAIFVISVVVSGAGLFWVLRRRPDDDGPGGATDGGDAGQSTYMPPAIHDPAALVGAGAVVGAGVPAATWPTAPQPGYGPPPGYPVPPPGPPYPGAYPEAGYPQQTWPAQPEGYPTPPPSPYPPQPGYPQAPGYAPPAPPAPPVVPPPPTYPSTPASTEPQVPPPPTYPAPPDTTLHPGDGHPGEADPGGVGPGPDA